MQDHSRFENCRQKAGAHQRHLPSTSVGTGPVRGSCLPLTCPKRSSGWTTGMRHLVLQENWWSSYFQELILWAQCLHVFISNKSTKSLRGDISSSSLAENLLYAKCLTAWTLPSPESHKLNFRPHPTSLDQSLKPSEVLSPGWQPNILLQIKLNSHLSCCVSFLSQQNQLM